MDKLEFKGAWHEIVGKVKSKYGELTDDDLAYSEGQEEQLIGNVQKRLGHTREQVINMFKSL